MTLRRILVGIDASPFSRMALRSAVALAERVDAALDAVFVEDINIVRLAAHPMAQGFSLTPPHSHDMDEALVAAMLELQSAAARKAFDEAQGPARSFIVRRGRVEAELLDAAQGADLICLGWSGRAAAGSRPRLGAVARILAARAAVPVLLSRGPAAGPVVVLWDGTEAAGRALAAAGRLSAQVGLVIPENDPLRLIPLEAAARLCPAARNLELTHVSAGTFPGCLNRLPAEAILVVPAGTDWAIETIPCSVVISR